MKNEKVIRNQMIMLYVEFKQFIHSSISSYSSYNSSYLYMSQQKNLVFFFSLNKNDDNSKQKKILFYLNQELVNLKDSFHWNGNN